MKHVGLRGMSDIGPLVNGADRRTTLGIAAWTEPPVSLTSTLKPASGVLIANIAEMIEPLDSGASVTFGLEVTTAGATLTAAQNLIGLYTLSGSTLTRVAQSADQATAWTATGVKAATATLSAALNVGDIVYFALLSVGTTPPTFRSAITTGAPNWGPVKSRLQLTAQTTLPASLALSSLAATQNCHGIILY